MKTENLSADVCLNHHPRNGKQAYKMLLQALSNDIAEKQKILSELKNHDVRQKFIENWKPNTKSVNISNVQRRDLHAV